VDSTDYFLIDNGYALQGAPLAAGGAAAGAIVPEPSALSLMAVAAASLLMRPRKRQLSNIGL